MRLIYTARMWFGVGCLFVTVGASAATFTNLYIFSSDAFDSKFNSTNNDGIGPNSIVLPGNVIYGTAMAGGLNGDGTVFRVGTDGRQFTNNGGQPGRFSRTALVRQRALRDGLD